MINKYNKELFNKTNKQITADSNKKLYTSNLVFEYRAPELSTHVFDQDISIIYESIRSYRTLELDIIQMQTDTLYFGIEKEINDGLIVGKFWHWSTISLKDNMVYVESDDEDFYLIVQEIMKDNNLKYKSYFIKSNR